MLDDNAAMYRDGLSFDRLLNSGFLGANVVPTALEIAVACGFLMNCGKGGRNLQSVTLQRRKRRQRVSANTPG